MYVAYNIQPVSLCLLSSEKLPFPFLVCVWALLGIADFKVGGEPLETQGAEVLTTLGLHTHRGLVQGDMLAET